MVSTRPYDIKEGKIIEYENAVLQILRTPRFSIKEIKEEYEKRNKKNIHENLSEQKNNSRRIWHYKIEMDEKVKELVYGTTKIPDENYPSGKSKFYHAIVHVIEKLNKNGLIIIWYNDGITGDGIWRLSEKGEEEIIRRNLPKL